MRRLRKCVMYLLSAIAVVASAQESTADGNIILNRPYTYYPAPNYPLCTDAGDRTQLTDGKRVSTPRAIWRLASTVGWISKVNVPVVVRFELKREATLSELRFYTVGGGAAGVVGVGVRVYGSLDNRTYVPIGEAPPPPPVQEGKKRTVLLLRRAALNQARAKYVAVAAMAPAPHYFVFVDEIELYGKSPADPASTLPNVPGIRASSAKDLQETLTRSHRHVTLAKNLTAPIERHISQWPNGVAAEIRNYGREFVSVSQKVESDEDFEDLRLAFIEKHRKLAKKVYGVDTLVWETIPDERFVMVSLPTVIKPPQASVHTVVNALEATALGVSNLAEKARPLTVSVSGGGNEAPKVVPRVARFFETAGARYVPDALLPADPPRTIPPGESRLVWVGIESTDARPGAYRYEMAVKLGEDLHRVPLKAFVHDVTLSKKTSLHTFNWAYLNDGGNNSPIYEKARDSMFSHRITTGACSAVGYPEKDAEGNVIRPVRINFIELDQYLAFNKDFPEISFFFPFHRRYDPPTRDMFGKAKWMSEDFKSIFKEWLVKFVGRIKAKGRDYDGFYLQMFDESVDVKVAEICMLVHEADPNVRMMITVPSRTHRSAIEPLIDAGMNIIVYHAPRLGYTPPSSLEGLLTLLRSSGGALWFYNAVGLDGSGREADPLNFYRLLHWLAFRYDATGVGFWNMLHSKRSCWAEGKRYFPLVYTVPDGQGNAPPPDVTSDETIIPSRRWEYVRMGIEDFMLLQMARRRIGKLEAAKQAEYQRKLKNIVQTATRDLPRPASHADRLTFRRQRQALIEMIEELDGE